MNGKFELPVLLYHRIVNKSMPVGKHKIYVSEKDFEKQMAYLHQKGIQPVTFFDLQQNPLMKLENKVILTFDDGYRDNYELMFPVLKKYNFKAVIYLVTQTDHNSWGVSQKEPRVDLMTDAQLQELSDYGIEIGGHTQHHPDLSKCSESRLITEIKGCREDIEKRIRKKAVSFAYPFGGINEAVKRVTKEAGYMFAVSTNTGPKAFGKDNYQIRRIEITPRTTLNSFKNKVSGYYFHPSFFHSLFKNKQLN